MYIELLIAVYIYPTSYIYTMIPINVLIYIDHIYHVCTSPSLCNFPNAMHACHGNHTQNT